MALTLITAGCAMQLCREHGIASDGMLQDCAAEVRLPAQLVVILPAKGNTQF